MTKGKRLNGSICKFFKAHEKWFRNGLYIIFPILLFCALVGKFSTLLLLLTFAVWISNIIYAIKKFRERFLFLLFHVTFFVFLMGRPLIGLVRSGNWIELQLSYGATEDSVFRLLYCMIVSLLALRVGAHLAEHYIRKNNALKRSYESLSRWTRKRMRAINGNWRALVRVLSLILFAAALVPKFALEIEKYLFIKQNSYKLYYAEFATNLPYPVCALSTTLPYALYAYLATFPSKKQSYAVLTLYVLTAVPLFLGGGRKELVLNLLFALIYFMFRDYRNKGTALEKEKWIGKFEIVLIILGATVGVCVLAAMVYIRAGTESNQGILDMFVEFFFSQGVSFSWMSAGYAKIAELRNTGVSSYTFGQFIDSVSHNILARKLFGAQAMPGINSLQQVTEGHNMSHYLSYMLLGETRYLEGNGVGSSYLIELYTDFDMLGVLVFSMGLGAYLNCAFYMAKNSPVFSMLLFCTAKEIFFMPRAEVITFLEFLWRLPFWCTVVYLLAGGCVISCILKKHRKRKLSGPERSDF